MNLRFADFSVLSESEGLRTEKRAFFPATWGGQHLPVTLMVSKDMALNNINIKNSFALTPIAQFVDQVPSYLVSHALGESNTGSNQGKHLIPLLLMYMTINMMTAMQTKCGSHIGRKPSLIQLHQCAKHTHFVSITLHRRHF